MPYADNAGVKIHYEVEGIGPPLVLQHGFTQRMNDWFEDDYVSALCRSYKLILIDARGHGTSDKPHDATAYTLDRRIADVTTVLDTLRIEKAHFWGYSMGGWIGFGLAKYAPQRINKLVIGGQHPFARDQSAFRRWIRQGIAEGPDAFVTAFEQTVGPVSAVYAERLRGADLRAWLAAVEDRVSIEDVLETMTMPCCLYAGNADPLFAQTKAASERIPNARFFPLPGLSHVQAFVQRQAVLPRVVEFLEETDPNA